MRNGGLGKRIKPILSKVTQALFHPRASRSSIKTIVIRRGNIEIKKYACNRCKKSFFTPHGLEIHKKTAHK